MTHRIANRSFNCGLFHFTLTADMVECEKKVMLIAQVCWELDLHFIIEVRTPSICNVMRRSTSHTEMVQNFIQWMFKKEAPK